MKRPIITLAAYCDLSELPTYHQEQVYKAFRYITTAKPDDDNTECYLKAEKDNGYTLTVEFFYNDDVPEVEIIYLDVTDEERPQLNQLIIKGLQYSLDRIAEI